MNNDIAERALIIPVLEAQDLANSFWIHHDDPAANQMPAHITVNFPFRPAPEIEPLCCLSKKMAANGESENPSH